MDKENILDNIHINLHAVRLMPNYKPSEFEKKISWIVSKHYATNENCQDCRASLLIMEQAKANPQKSGILNKIGEFMNN